MCGRSEAASKIVKLLSIKNAPAHAARVCAGVAVAALFVAGCEDGVRLGGGSRSLALESDTIQLAASVTLHDVAVRAAGNSDFDPAQVNAKIGDVVRFTVADTRTHALSVVPPNDAANQALVATNQLRSPPLVAQGQAWVISLDGVPAGSYTIRCISHAGHATLTVQ